MAGEIVQYQAEDGATALRLQASNDSVWLSQAEKASAKAAAGKGKREYDRWHQRATNAPSAVEQHFIEATANAKKFAADKPMKGKGGAA